MPRIDASRYLPGGRHLHQAPARGASATARSQPRYEGHASQTKAHRCSRFLLRDVRWALHQQQPHALSTGTAHPHEPSVVPPSLTVPPFLVPATGRTELCGPSTDIQARRKGVRLTIVTGSDRPGSASQAGAPAPRLELLSGRAPTDRLVQAVT